MKLLRVRVRTLQLILVVLDENFVQSNFGEIFKHLEELSRKELESSSMLLSTTTSSCADDESTSSSGSSGMYYQKKDSRFPVQNPLRKALADILEVHV